ncbi:ABC transporter permease [Dictyobacter kobayashii]|uniref:MacB-like periplasmic core domain-containing protein n=1 Tax=Dictyobacter kobayashii TaxID=2014872 RepID=A0A402AVE9_9CHLR|nr:ABC transporter permease [Dictyobacter kobayashii]GCE23088.1 hypothetical protein KDK_68880 [Dictyobacter kobayashii]
MRVLLKKALKDVTRRKMRSFLTILGIALGVMGLTALSIAATQFENSFSYTTDTSSLADIQITTAPTSPSLVTDLQRQPNVALVQAAGYSAW